MTSRRRAVFEVFRALTQIVGALIDLAIYGLAIWCLFLLATSERDSVDEHNAIRGAVSLILFFAISTFAKVRTTERKR